jgi:hypothetical protein
VAALVLYQWCGSPERGDGLPLVRSGGGRALHGHRQLRRYSLFGFAIMANQGHERLQICNDCVSWLRTQSGDLAPFCNPRILRPSPKSIKAPKIEKFRPSCVSIALIC